MIRLLLIDDDEIDRQTVIRALRKTPLDIETVACDSAREGLETFFSADFSCVLLDFNLPDMGGLDVLKKMKEPGKGKTTPVIILTGMHDDRLIVRTMREGAQDFLSKDNLTPAILENMITNTLQRDKLKQENREIGGELEKKTRFLETVNNTMSDGLLVTDKDGIILSANRACEKIFGYSKDHLVGRNLDILMSSEDAKDHQKKINAYIRTGKSNIIGMGEQEITGRRKDGRELSLTIAINATEEDGKILFVSCVCDGTKRKEAERARKKAEERYRLLAENMTDIILLEDPQSNVIYISPSLSNHLGYDPKEAVGKNSWDMVHPEDRKTKKARWEQGVIKEKKACLTEWRFRHKKGHYLWFESLCTPILDKKNNVTGVVSTSRQVTERKQADEARREAETKLKMIADHSGDIITLCTPKGRVLYATPALKKHLGIDPEKFVGRNTFDLLHPDEKEKVPDLWKREVQQAGKQIVIDQRLRNAKGKYLWFERLSEPIFDDKGKLSLVVTTSRNIEKIKKTEAEVTQLGRIIENSLNEIYVFDGKTFRFSMVNRGARQNLGYSMAELSKLTAYDLNSGMTKAEFKRYLAPLFSGEKEQVFLQTRQRRKDGSEYDVEVYLQKTDLGGKTAFMGMAEDVTERKIAESKFRQVQKMEAIGNLTGGVAHDFNNLLTAIIGSLQYLKMLENKIPPEAMELINIAVNSSRRGADLTKRLLALSRRQDLNPRVVGVRDLIEDQMALLDRTLRENIEIETHFPKDQPFVFVDPGELENCFLNLAVNAQDAMPDGGHLTFEVHREILGPENSGLKNIEPGDYVVISISDTGTGIPKKVRDKIFDPFFTTKEVGKGTGLGLAMVYGFVRQSKGNISVYSEENRGTTFKIFLPETQQRPTKEVKLEGDIDINVKETGTILLVEDDEGVRAFVTKALKAMGYTVVRADNGPAALKEIRNNPDIDLLLTDVILPRGLTGYEIAHQFRANHPDSGIILSSGYTGEHIKKNGLEKVDWPLLSKPYDLKVLLARVKEEIRKPKKPRKKGKE